MKQLKLSLALAHKQSLQYTMCAIHIVSNISRRTKLHKMKNVSR